MLDNLLSNGVTALTQLATSVKQIADNLTTLNELIRDGYVAMPTPVTLGESLGFPLDHTGTNTVNESAPAAQQPTAQPTVAPSQLPEVKLPDAHAPVAQQPVAQQPVAQQPVAQQPVVQQPTADADFSAVSSEPTIDFAAVQALTNTGLKLFGKPPIAELIGTMGSEKLKDMPPANYGKYHAQLSAMIQQKVNNTNTPAVGF